jgi:hypothetical protein
MTSVGPANLVPRDARGDGSVDWIAGRYSLVFCPWPWSTRVAQGCAADAGSVVLSPDYQVEPGVTGKVTNFG